MSLQYTLTTRSSALDGDHLSPPVNLNTVVHPVRHVLDKLIQFERLDRRHEFSAMRALIQQDSDVAAWWVYHTFNCLFVWQFIYSHEENEDMTWLKDAFSSEVGESRFQGMCVRLIDYLHSVGETIEDNI